MIKCIPIFLHILIPIVCLASCITPKNVPNFNKKHKGHDWVVVHNDKYAFYSYRNHIKHGKSAVYDKSGKLIIKGGYRNGKPSGLWKSYHNGKIDSKILYTKKDTILILYTTHNNLDF